MNSKHENHKGNKLEITIDFYANILNGSLPLYNQTE